MKRVCLSVACASLAVLGVSGEVPRTPAFSLAKPGVVKPTGWLRDWALTMARGYTSRMDEIDPEFVRAWSKDYRPRGKDLDWSSGGTWSCEGGAYWFDGLVKLAFQLDDAELKAHAKRRLDPLLDNMTDHPIGFCWWFDRREPAHFREIASSTDWMVNWVSGIMSRPVGAWYQATGDARAKRALEAALGDDYWNHSFTNNPCDAVPNSVISFPSGARTALRATGSPKIAAALRAYALDYAKNPARETFGPAPTNGLENTLALKRDEMFAKKIVLRHGVIANESLHSLFASAVASGDEGLMDSWRKWMDFLDTRARLPVGAWVMDEEWGHPGPRRGVETCALAAEIWCRLDYLATLGQGRYGDDIERAFFNAAPACVTRDCRAHVYMQQPNRVRGGDSERLSVPASGVVQTRFQEKHFPLCCTAGLNRLIPDFIQGMWMTTADGGVAAALYGPCTFETSLAGGTLSLVEETDYPFGETVVIRVKAAPAGEIPLALRLPRWCVDAALSVNGQPVSLAVADGFVRVRRVWKAGDAVSLRLPMKPRVEVAKDMDETHLDYASVTAGPLLFALGYAEKTANEPTEPAVIPAVKVKELASSATLERSPLVRPFDWPLAAPVRLRTTDAAGRPLELVPYGCTQLRAAMLPVQDDVREPYLALDDADVTHPLGRDRLRDSWQKVGDSFVRKLAVITKGRLEFRTVFTAPNGLPVKVEFLGPDRRPVWSDTSLGGEYRAAFDVVRPIAYLRVTPGLTTDAWDVMRMPLRISVDHALDETFAFTPFGQLPGGWTGTASVVTNCMASAGAWDAKGVSSDPFLAVGPGGNAEVRFTPEEGKYAVSFQTYAHAASDLRVTLPNGRKVSFRGMDFVFSEASEGGLRYRATEGVWYTLRFEIDPVANKTFVKLNGRALGTIPCGGADGGRLTFANTGTVASCVDDVKVRALPEFADGVPEPVVPHDAKGNVVGINVCSLWHEGSHWGWDCVSHCDSPRPVLGFYDEGEGESADWEIKYMVEHGIDFQAFCWYAETWTGPIKHPSLAYQLDDGFKNAKWSSKMSYCLIWECANAAIPHNFDVWRTYYVPYLIEHHFKDPRHLKIRNRIPLFVFGGGWHLVNRFGGADKMRAAFDYLENEVKKLGFDGMIYVLSHEASNPDYAKMGYDATAAYNWGVGAWSYDVNTNCNWNNSKDRSCYTIPTISVGFNNEPWGGDPRPMMTPADFAKSLAWARDVFSPATAAKGTWQENLFMISTWNEYGEGTYIMPTRDERGFGYLDAVRSVFTDEKPDPKLNLVPTPRQLARINRMFRAEPESVWGDVVTSWTFADGDTHGWTVLMGVEGLRGTSQGLAFKTSTTDPALAVWFSPFLAKRFKEVVVRLKTTAKAGALQLFWTKPGGKAHEGASVAVPIVADEKVREYVLPVATCPAWRGRIGSLRLDTGNTSGESFTLESVRMR